MVPVAEAQATLFFDTPTRQGNHRRLTMRKANRTQSVAFVPAQAAAPAAPTGQRKHRHPNGTMLLVNLPWKLNKKNSTYWAQIPDAWLSEANLAKKEAYQNAMALAMELKADFVQSAFGPEKIGAKVNVAIHKGSCGICLDEREEAEDNSAPGIKF